MARTNPAKFFRQVRQELGKVTWPTQKEATVTTIMVLIMVALMSGFFVLVDQILSFGIQWVLGLGA